MALLLLIVASELTLLVMRLLLFLTMQLLIDVRGTFEAPTWPGLAVLKPPPISIKVGKAMELDLPKIDARLTNGFEPLSELLLLLLLTLAASDDDTDDEDAVDEVDDAADADG